MNSIIRLSLLLVAVAAATAERDLDQYIAGRPVAGVAPGIRPLSAGVQTKPLARPSQTLPLIQTKPLPRPSQQAGYQTKPLARPSQGYQTKPLRRPVRQTKPLARPSQQEGIQTRPLERPSKQTRPFRRPSQQADRDGDFVIPDRDQIQIEERPQQHHRPQTLPATLDESE